MDEIFEYHYLLKIKLSKHAAIVKLHSNKQQKQR